MFRKKKFKLEDYYIKNLYMPQKQVKKSLTETISNFLEYYSIPRIGDKANPYRKLYLEEDYISAKQDKNFIGKILKYYLTPRLGDEANPYKKRDCRKF
ncbi:MAG: hypothetical protein PHV16_03740 [Candidatus Nanoarchaeia archaeon]|nr:hypothetical protein [Candidatus Nanoarchaeia archaeon]